MKAKSRSQRHQLTKKSTLDFRRQQRKSDFLDGDVDANLGRSCLWHPAGTAAMGKVVDTKLRVNGVKGLRVVDASVLPIPISCPIQACVYALGEQAADIILSDLESASSQ